MIPQATIDKIFEAVDIYEVVSDYVTLKKRGVNYLGLCPFHNERTPSFTVSPQKELFKCFGCGKGGNAVSFIMEHDGLGYVEALKVLAKKYNITIEEIFDNVSKEEINKRDSLYIITQRATQFYHNNLLENEEGKMIALSYLKERGVNQQSIEKFLLGWSLNKSDSFSTLALKEGFLEDNLIDTGLTLKGYNDNLIDRFKNRLIFPIHNLSGKVSGFGGRILHKSDKEAKYINSPDNDIYNKSEIVYGLYQARQSIQKKEYCIVVEGYMDVISMHQNGFENTVSSSGTSLTIGQLRLIKRYCESVILLFDGDEAGKKASLKSIPLVLEAGLDVKICTLPKEHDPDTFVQSMKMEEVEEYLSTQSKTFINYLIDNEQDVSDPLKKVDLIKSIINNVILIQDALLKDVYIKTAIKALDVDEQLFYSELNKQSIKKEDKAFSVPEQDTKDAIEAIENASEPTPQTLLKQNTAEHQEKQLIKLLLLNGRKLYNEFITVSEYIHLSLGIIEWENKNCELIYNEIISHFELENHLERIFLDFTYFTNHPNNEIVQFVTDLVFVNHTLDKGWQIALDKPISNPNDDYLDEVESALNYFKLRKILVMIKENEQAIINCNVNDEDELNHLLEIHSHLNKMKTEITKQKKIDML